RSYPSTSRRALERTRSRGTGCSSPAIRERAPPLADSDIEVGRVEGVLLDELAPGLDRIAHQRREHLLRLGHVVRVDLEKGPALWVHRRRPELLGVHLAETLVALDLQALLRGALDHPDEVEGRGRDLRRPAFLGRDLVRRASDSGEGSA